MVYVFVIRRNVIIIIMMRLFMKKILLLGLLLCGQVVSASQEYTFNDTAVGEYSASKPEAQSYGCLVEYFNKKITLSPTGSTRGVSVVIGKKMDESPLKASIEKINFGIFKENKEAFVLFANNMQQYHTGEEVTIPCFRYILQKSKFIESTLAMPEITQENNYPLAIFCINKIAMTLDNNVLIKHMNSLIAKTKPDQNSNMHLVVMIDEDGLDTNAYPLLNMLCEQLNLKKAGWVAACISPREDILFMDNGKLNLSQNGAIPENHLVRMRDKLTPWSRTFKNIFLSPLFAIIVLGGVIFIQFR